MKDRRVAKRYALALFETAAELGKIEQIDEELVNLYKKILEVSHNERSGYQELLSGIVIHLLAYLLYREKDKNWKDKVALNKIDKARLIIREKINEQIYPEELAACSGNIPDWRRHNTLLSLKYRKPKNCCLLPTNQLKKLQLSWDSNQLTISLPNSGKKQECLPVSSEI